MGSYHVYFAANIKNGGIYHYLWENGKPIFVSKTEANRPMYLDVEGDTMHVLLNAPFAYSNHSAMVDYPINPDGTLGEPSEMLDTQGVSGCHLCHFAGKEYIANYTSGNIFCNDGKVDQHAGKGPNLRRQEGPHTHFIAPSPDGKYLLSTDLGLDTVYTYDQDLNVVSTAKVPAGHGCRHLAYSEDGKYVFCVNELKSTVSVFAYDDGKLTLLDTVEALKAPNPNNTAAAIRVDGNMVFVSQRGANAISVMKWEDEKLTLCGVYPCGGDFPRDFIVLENQLLITNEKSDTLSVLWRDGDKLVNKGLRLLMESVLCAVAVPVKKASEGIKKGEA